LGPAVRLVGSLVLGPLSQHERVEQRMLEGIAASGLVLLSDGPVAVHNTEFRARGGSDGAEFLLGSWRSALELLLVQSLLASINHSMVLVEVHLVKGVAVLLAFCRNQRILVLVSHYHLVWRLLRCLLPRQLVPPGALAAR
jgi:hypothetical protein